MKKGKFITFEGPEGSGKSTHIQLLAAYLETQGVAVTITREPGGTLTGEAIRLLLQHNSAGEAPVARAEVLLFLASRAQHVERLIQPALHAGRWVLCDRFDASTLAYQGYGRGFDLDALRALNQFATQDLTPDLTLLLDIQPEQGRTRLHARQQATATTLDRFECEASAFHARVREGFLDLARREPERYLRINTDAAREEVALIIQNAIKKRFGEGKTHAF